MKKLFLGGFALTLLIAWAFADGEGLIFTRTGGGSAGSVPASVTNALSTISSNGVQVATGVTNIDFLGFGIISNVSGNVFVNPPAGGGVTGPYILFTNGHGTNASFWDGLKVDGDGMTNAGPYRGKYVLSDIGTVNAANSTNIGATAVWNETDEIFSAVNIKAVDNAAASESSALLRLDWDSQGTHQIDWLAATGLQGTYRIRTDGSTHQSGNANVHGTVSTTNLVITNRVTQALKTLAYSGTNVTVDWSQGNHFYLLLTNNAKLWFTNAPGANWSQTGLIDLVQDGTGTRLLYWDSTNIRTNPAQSVVLSTPANAIDDMHVKTDSTGTNFHILLNTGWAK